MANDFDDMSWAMTLMSWGNRGECLWEFVMGKFI